MRTISQDDLQAAVKAIEEGELVVVPTERWYMICADAGNSAACQRIFRGKQRAFTKPLVLVVASPEECENRFRLTSEARRLAQAFWPGNLALLLPWRDAAEGASHAAVGSPALVTHASGPLGAVAAMSRKTVAATTVNISGDAGTAAPGPAITLGEVDAFLNESGIKPAVSLDGGVCPAAHHLTIVDCSDEMARLRRPGLVHQRALSVALGRELTSE